MCDNGHNCIRSKFVKWHAWSKDSALEAATKIKGVHPPPASYGTATTSYRTASSSTARAGTADEMKMILGCKSSPSSSSAGGGVAATLALLDVAAASGLAAVRRWATCVRPGAVLGRPGDPPEALRVEGKMFA